MKFLGGRLRQLREALLASAVDPQAAIAEISTENEARKAAQAARAYDLRVACATRLKPYVHRLFLVNNFKGAQLTENATRVGTAVLARLGPDVPIGISALLSSGRSSESHDALVETAGALGRGIGERAVPLRPEREGADAWLLSLARAAEATTRQVSLPPMSWAVSL